MVLTFETEPNNEILILRVHNQLSFENPADRVAGHRVRISGL
jgi:hypothetical protein